MLEEPKKNLQRVIHKFVSQMVKSIELCKNEPSLLSKTELDKLSERIWEMRHFAVELLEYHPEESTWYNASIVQQIVEQPILLQGSCKKTTLIQAADYCKKQNNDACLRLIVTSWACEGAPCNVLLTNLQEISEELTA